MLRYPSLVGCVLTVFAMFFVLYQAVTGPEYQHASSGEITILESSFSHLFSASPGRAALKIRLNTNTEN